MKLNKAQQEAVDYIQGPLLVLAGAGSGKTRVITNKIVKMVSSGYFLADKILAVTFTNKAASEMKERVALELSANLANSIWISTFHSLGLEILKEEHQLVGLNRNFSLFDDNDTFKIVKDIVKEKYKALLTEKGEKTVVEDVIYKISIWKGQLLTPENLSHHDIYACIYKDYRDYLYSCSAIDFDDLIFITTLLLRENEVIRNKWQDRFDYVMVDEYQDTNNTQYELLKLLVSQKRRFMVVGDDDQSIYSWRGANPENIKLLAKEFSDLKVVKLETNYRSCGNILHCANEVIAHNPHLFDKKLIAHLDNGPKVKIIICNNEQTELDSIVSVILKKRMLYKSNWNEFAILYRSNFQARQYENALIKANIPSVITGGTSFFSLAEIKDILCWCRFIINLKDDISLLRIINIPRRGIGAETISKLGQLAKEQKTCLFRALLSENFRKHLNTKQLDNLKDFLKTIDELRGLLLDGKHLTLANSLLNIIKYKNYLLANNDKPEVADIKYKNALSLMETIEGMILGKGEDGGISFNKSVERITMREMMERQKDSNDEEVNAVQLMTLHAAKGLEFNYVFLVGLEEGTLPHKNSVSSDFGIHEERRLCYVGITRAKQELFITCARKRQKGFDIQSKILSRFLSEFPKDAIQMVSTVQELSDNEDMPKNKKINVFDEALKALFGKTN